MKPMERLDAIKYLSSPQVFDSPESAQRFVDTLDEVWPNAAIPDQHKQVVLQNKLDARSVLAGIFDTAQAAVMFGLASGPKTIKDLCIGQTTYTINTIRQTVSNLNTTGMIVRCGRGVYALPDHITRYAPERRVRNVQELIEAFFDEHPSGTLLEIVGWGKTRGFFKGYDKVDYELRTLARLKIVQKEETTEVWRRITE